MRTMRECEKCGETRELATVNPPRCFKCYRQDQREQKELWHSNRNLKDVAKEQTKNRKALMKMMDALEDLTLVPETTKEAFRKLLRPEVGKIVLLLDDPLPVNSEHEAVSEQVNSEQEVASESVNGEQESVSEQVHPAA